MQYVDNIVLCVVMLIVLYWTVVGIHTYIFPLLSEDEDNE